MASHAIGYERLPPIKLGFKQVDKPTTISFHHLGYDAPHTCLFVLLAVDKEGVDYEIARIACAIVAGNNFGRWFSTDRHGKDPVDSDTEVLVAAIY